MEYTVENYAVLFNEEYSNADEFEKEFSIVKELFEIEKPEEITIVTSEDGDVIQSRIIDKLSSSMLDKEPIKDVISSEFDAYYLYKVDDIELIINRYPFDIIFIKIADKEKFENLIKRYV